jgi:Tol biopolymer transport system component
MMRAAPSAVLLFAAAVLACDDSSAPPGPVVIPAFIYVADSGGFAQLSRFQTGTVTPLTAASSNNIDPNSAADRLVFTSDRDGYWQVYIADLAVTTPHRVMNSSAFDMTPALSPRADSIVFVSTRSGAPRLWVIAAPALDAVGYGTPAALATGSPTYIPESAPVWSPIGGAIAFTSTATGVSQVYVVPSGGGTEMQVTNESGGAFQPAWSADGATIYYIAASPTLTLRRVSANGGGGSTAAADSLGVAGPASCNGSVCLFSTDPGGSAGAMCALPVSGAPVQSVFPRTGAQERQPAVLAP